MDSINPNFKKIISSLNFDPNHLVAQIRNQNKAALSQALTLVESKKLQHRNIAQQLIQHALNSKKIPYE